jgi:hypothetical protein
VLFEVFFCNLDGEKCNFCKYSFGIEMYVHTQKSEPFLINLAFLQMNICKYGIKSSESFETSRSHARNQPRESYRGNGQCAA